MKMYVIGHAANYLSPVTHAELPRSFSQFKPAPACSHSFAYIFECFFFWTPPYIFSFSVLIYSNVCHNTVERELRHCFRFIMTSKLHEEVSLCRGLTWDVKSCCWSCRPSLRSQERTVLSRPPVQSLVPSWEMSMQLAPSVWPWNCLQIAKSEGFRKWPCF